MDVGAPASTINAAGTDGYWRWNSPLPYLYGGLAAVLGLIALALVVLACSHFKSPDDNSSPDDDMENPVKRSLPKLEYEPKFAVIMAGNAEPTYLANPVSSIYNVRQQEV